MRIRNTITLLFLMFSVGMLWWAFAHPSVLTVSPEENAAAVSAVIPEVVNSIQPQSISPHTDGVRSIKHIPIPDSVKAIYMSACVAGTPDFRSDLVQLIADTELNAVIIDIKDYTGTISFPTDDPFWGAAWEAAECGAYDMDSFIAELHQQGVYVIGRLTVFQDPRYAVMYPNQAVQRRDGSVWTDYKGLSFVDVAATSYWDRVIELTALSYNIGFDEINFDYIRYPSDGNMYNMYYPYSETSEIGLHKAGQLETFFAYLSETMTDPAIFAGVVHENTGRDVSVPWISANLFGMTTENTGDLSIGQIQERAVPYFDFIAPMVYPSHYPYGHLGLGNPNEHPYDIVYHAMAAGVARAAATTTDIFALAHEPLMAGTSTASGRYTKDARDGSAFRTWIQDFDYGGVYDAAAVRAQIQASYDAGVDSWMVWAPSNRYTKAAFLPKAVTRIPASVD